MVGEMTLERKTTSWYLCGLVVKEDKDMETLDSVEMVSLSGGFWKEGFS